MSVDKSVDDRKNYKILQRSTNSHTKQIMHQYAPDEIYWTGQKLEKIATV